MRLWFTGLGESLDINPNYLPKLLIEDRVYIDMWDRQSICYYYFSYSAYDHPLYNTQIQKYKNLLRLCRRIIPNDSVDNFMRYDYELRKFLSLSSIMFIQDKYQRFL